MKTIGLIGGISYHSTAVYYSLIDQLINEKLGENNAARIILYSVNYAEYKQLQNNNDWRGIEIMLSDIAIKLENAGADCILLCCNTAHLIADQLIQKLSIPFLHIADETAIEIKKQGLSKVGLLGTKFTMENPFFSDRLIAAGIETMLPEPNEMELIHSAIQDELAKGNLSPDSKKLFQLVIRDFKERGAEAVIFGCTEIGMFIQQSESELEIFDTTFIHAKAAVEFALSSPEKLLGKKYFDIKLGGEISNLFLEKGITNFQDAFDYVKQMPYRRNSNKADLTSLFVDGCGTCSTKHALLKQLAIENNFGGLKLMMGIFRMNPKNTPEIGSTLQEYNLDYIPEAHCYLKFDKEILDATKSNSKPEDFVKDLIEEQEILPFQILDYKVAYHKKYLENCLNQNQIKGYNINELWAIREKCIQDLSEINGD